jgi:hypothetical protein
MSKEWLTSTPINDVHLDIFVLEEHHLHIQLKLQLLQQIESAQLVAFVQREQHQEVHVQMVNFKIVLVKAHVNHALLDTIVMDQDLPLQLENA